MRHVLRHARLHTLAVALAAAGIGLGGTGPATAADRPVAATNTASRADGCAEVAWGSQPEVEWKPGGASVHGVHAGRHPCFDRLVLDVSGPANNSGFIVRYVNVVRDDSGAVIPLRGGAQLEVAVTAHRFHPEDRIHVDVNGFRTFRQVASGNSALEGITTYGLGLRARLPFRVFVLNGASDPEGFSRIVVDVAHQW
jgi:hypothetical protein